MLLRHTTSLFCIGAQHYFIYAVSIHTTVMCSQHCWAILMTTNQRPDYKSRGLYEAVIG